MKNSNVVFKVSAVASIAAAAIACAPPQQGTQNSNNNNGGNKKAIYTPSIGAFAAHLDPAHPAVHHVHTNGNRVYLTSPQGLQIVDLDLSSNSFSTTITQGSNSLTTVGNDLFIAKNTGFFYPVGNNYPKLTKHHGTAETAVSAIAHAGGSTFILGHPTQGVSVVDLTDKKAPKAKDHPSFKNKNVHSLYVDSTTLYIGTQYGLFIEHTPTLNLKTPEKKTALSSLGKIKVQTIYANGPLIMVGTNAGLKVSNDGGVSFKDQDEFKGTDVKQVVGRDGMIAVAYTKPSGKGGIGFSRDYGASFELFKKSLPNKQVLSVAIDENGNLIVGTQQGAFPITFTVTYTE